jgi:hypothetical protein
VVDVTFDPIGTGGFAASLTITDNGKTAPQSVMRAGNEN